ncbi:caspase recruitment domain-containing protein 19 isoform X1 [Lynx canadensis]|uniref:caspase recruitment domain-containing protein 19 isoform X1 n=1 Tax=Lynx canadensis TaxID=61383 RepID=UPI0011B0CEA9|nr:caspase recruitment domain-containing protein 19 isoform X1 [Lynx canadensis]
MILFPSHRVEFCFPLAGRLLGCLVHSVYNCPADPSWLLDTHRPLSQACPCSSYRLTCVTLEQTYCDRLVQDAPFLMGHGRLSEQQVDRIILQLNRYYPQILSNSDAEKFRNPKASLRVRLCDLLGHLQRSGERDCQEFYRALYIHAQPLHSRLPSRLALRKCAPRAPRQEQAVGCGHCRISRACCYTGGGVWRVWLRPPSSLVPWGPSPAGWGPLTAVPALNICAPVAETVVVPTTEGALAGGGGIPIMWAFL